MARIIIAPGGGGTELEVDQSAFDNHFFPGYIYVRDASPTASSEPSAEEVRMAAAVAAGTGPLPLALRAALVPFWEAGETVGAGTVRVDATGHIISRNSSGTTRGSYDATEQALWTAVPGGSGITTTQAAGIAAGLAIVFGS